MPSIGLVLGSLVGARLTRKYALKSIMVSGILISTIGTILMLIAIMLDLPVLLSIFLPMMVIYLGLCFIMANTSTLAMNRVTDKANGSAVMNFMNMGLATLIVLSLGLFPMSVMVLPSVYTFLCIGMLVVLAMHEKLNSNIIG